MTTNKIEPRTLKGFRDFLPKEQKARQEMLLKIQEVFESFGFEPIYTPALEYKEILLNKYGEDEKLVYSFTDHGAREIALRYDLTVPLARFVAEHQSTLTYPFRRYQIAPVWRAENTQRGRSREFIQCDVDIVGTDSELADAEIIACFCKVLETLGIKNFEARINDRKLFNIFQNASGGSPEQIVTIIRGIDKVEKIGVEGVLEYLKNQGISGKLLEQVEKFLSIRDSQNIFTEIQNQFEEGSALVGYIQKLMKNIMRFGVSADKLAFDPFIARGLDYYTGMVFEIVLKDKPEFGSVTGGGRYDSLVDQFSNKPLPAVGASLGIDRLFEALESAGNLPTGTNADCLVLNLSKSLTEDYLDMLKKLRSNGISSEIYYEEEKLPKQFKYAESKSIRYALIFGNEEKELGQVKVKNITSREEESVALENITDFIQKKLNK